MLLEVAETDAVDLCKLLSACMHDLLSLSSEQELEQGTSDREIRSA